MANDLNLCQFIGRLGKDVEIRYSAGGLAVASFSLAVGWKSKDKEGTEWINCSAFGKAAELLNQYVKKGSKLYVSGRWKTEKWQDQSGNDRYTTKLMVDNFQFLDSRPEGQKPDVNHTPAIDDFDDSSIPF